MRATFIKQQGLEISVYSGKPTQKSLMHTCVCANVPSEQPWSGEGLATSGTHAGESV